ncbi:hypothetical protein EVAR_63883_1 [Eumeta japonica]|uniref:Uncharacterized protein n=1 Tax=Eumeta variegata TaxID=151549 RepID=A0A4C1ZF30_EUMVA|nr:hypothetical protein EVAR_63883_1 [Eumeta japonica]
MSFVSEPEEIPNVTDSVARDPLMEIEEQPENKADNKSIKISNIRINCQRFRTYGPDTRGFSSTDQTEFEKFIVGPVFQDIENNIEKSIIESDFSHHRDTSNTMDWNPEANKEIIEDIELKYDIDDWVVVEYKMKKDCQYFIGKIIDKMCSTLI